MYSVWFVIKVAAFIYISTIILYFVIPSLVHNRPISTEPTKSKDYEELINEKIESAALKYQRLKDLRPKTLEDVVTFYKSKFHKLPPPRFDKWWEYCENNNVEFCYLYLETINENLEPFWGVEPEVLRDQISAMKDQYYDLCPCKIQNGNANFYGRDCFRDEYIAKIIEDLESDLPDTEILFNKHDTARVVAKYNVKEELRRIGKEVVMDNVTLKDYPPLNIADKSDLKLDANLNDGKAVFTFTQMACPIDSKINSNYALKEFIDAEVYDIIKKEDKIDVCQHPEFLHQQSLFTGQNVGVTFQDLVPVFSDSKPTAFGDILYPSCAYYSDFHDGAYKYDSSNDIDWEKKKSKMVFKGFANGGIQNEYNWYYVPRTRFATMVQPGLKFNKYSLKPVSYDSKLEKFKKSKFHVALFFEHPNEEAEKMLPKPIYESLGEQFKNKYFIDIDGFGHSARLRALMQSKSLPFKATMMEEWHKSFLIPWYQYVPIDNSYVDVFPVLGFFDGISTRDYNIEPHQNQAKRIAFQGRESANSDYNYESLRAYMYILILEYTRLLHNDRAEMAFSI